LPSSPTFPRADDPANVATPGVHHEVILVVHVPERADPDLAVVTTAVLGFDDGVLEDQGGVPEIDTVLVEIDARSHVWNRRLRRS
jgi:hypothetical protein